VIETTSAEPGLVHDLGPVERIPIGEGRVFVVGDRELAVFRARDGRVFAAQASCPHRSGPLADGLLGGSTVVCPLHGFKFDLATGAPKGNDCRALATYPASVNERGHVLVRVEWR
jgi:nitrite reductase (NADH) small subunit